MAITVTVPNHYKYLLKTKQIDESSDTYKIILMNPTFVFDKDSHAELADVTADQLPTGNGYTQNSKTLPGSRSLKTTPLTKQKPDGPMCPGRLPAEPSDRPVLRLFTMIRFQVTPLPAASILEPTTRYQTAKAF